MEEQVACITDGGCRQMARLPNILFGNAPAAATTPQAEEAPAEPTPGSVITIEGEDAESPPADEGTVEPTPASVITIEGEEAE